MSRYQTGGWASLVCLPSRCPPENGITLSQKVDHFSGGTPQALAQSRRSGLQGSTCTALWSLTRRQLQSDLASVRSYQTAAQTRYHAAPVRQTRSLPTARAKQDGPTAPNVATPKYGSHARQTSRQHRSPSRPAATSPPPPAPSLHPA